MKPYKRAMQRPVSMPPNAPLAPSSQHGHMRRDSNHVESSGMGMGRGGMPPTGSRRGGHNVSNSYGSQYSPHHHQGHQNHTQYNAGAFSPAQSYRGLANQPRTGVNGGGNPGGGSNVTGPGNNPVMGGSGYQPAGHMGGYSGNRGGRSPAMTHSLPSTPQMNSAQLVGNQSIHSPQFQYAQHLGPHVSFEFL